LPAQEFFGSVVDGKLRARLFRTYTRAEVYRKLYRGLASLRERLGLYYLPDPDIYLLKSSQLVSCIPPPGA
jgi:hypothetical protein